MTEQPITVLGGWTDLGAVTGNAVDAQAASTNLRSVLDALDVPIVVVDRAFTIGGFNRAAARAFHISMSDVGRSPCDVTALANLAYLEGECREVMAGSKESRVDFLDGDKCFVVRIAPYDRGDRAVTGAVMSFTNVTAFRAHINQAVYERESTKVILNTIADSLVVLSADQRIQSGNRAFYRMFGASREETQGVPFLEFGNGAFDCAPLRRRLRTKLFHDRVPSVEVDDVVTAKGPRTLSLDVRPLTFSGHSEHRILVTFQDITARKLAEAAKDLRSEEELRRSEAFLADGQRLSMTGSFSWKVESGEMTWSDQLYRIYEFEVGVPVTRELIRTRVHQDDVSLIEKIKLLDQVPDGGTDLEWQYRLIMPDGSVKYLHAVARVVRDRAGQQEYIATVQDVTAGRLSEEALAKARSELATVARATSLGMLTASIAHEVNQPLTGVITNAGTCIRMLESTPPDLEGARETARRTIRDGNRASDVITRLRALFRSEELTLELVDLNEAAREVMALTVSDLQRTRVAAEAELAADLPIITCDRIQIQQVLLNLLRNASDALVDVHDRPRQLLIKTAREDSDRVRVSVRDAGVGIDATTMNKLTDAFYTTKTDGMGIGLSVSRSIVERHGGRLWAEPNVGPGATFSFSLPSAPRSATDAAHQRGAS
jgi:PAS domain S-box-containing protein